MEVVECLPDDPRKHEVPGTEQARRERRLRVHERKSNDRVDARRERRRLHDDQQLSPGNEPRKRSEENEDRIDVGAEARDLLACRGVRHLERSTVGCAPDGLDHVPQVEAVRQELVVAPDRRRADESCPHCGGGRHDHIARGAGMASGNDRLRNHRGPALRDLVDGNRDDLGHDSKRRTRTGRLAPPSWIRRRRRRAGSRRSRPSSPPARTPRPPRAP